MQLGQMFPSKSLKKEDFPFPRTCTIESVQIITFKDDDGGEDKKPSLKFVGMDKPLALNWGNAQTIADVYGAETDNWIGKQIEVFVDPSVMFQGKRIGGIRVRMPMGTHQAVAQQTMASWTWDQAVAAAFNAGISKPDLIASLKAEGMTAYNMLTGTRLVKEIIEAKQAKGDTSFDDDPFAITPPPSDGSIPF